MKKTAFLLLASAMVLAGSVQALAYGMDNYNDYQNEDGTYSYYFIDQGVTVTMSEEWYQNTIVVAEANEATFYHRDSYEKYQEEGYEGGKLFTIGYSVNQDFAQLPSFEYLGFDEEEMLNYYVAFPTDYQAYPHDEAIVEEYTKLYTSKDEVIDSIEIEGVDREQEAEGSPEEMLMGGWSVTEDIALTDDVLALFVKASGGVTSADYEPLALLGTQLVAGTNYCLLCRDADQGGYVLVYIYQDLQGNAQIIGTKDIELGDFDYVEE